MKVYRNYNRKGQIKLNCTFYRKACNFKSLLLIPAYNPTTWETETKRLSKIHKFKATQHYYSKT